MKLSEKVLTKKDLLWKDNSDIAIYGTGLAGQTLYEALTKMNIHISFFLDGSIEKVGMKFCGKEIVDINCVNKNTVILIAANPIYKIHERLSHMGIEKWEYIDPEFMYLLCEGYDRKKIEHILKINEDNIFQVYNMLADEKSKKVFHAVLQHRLEHNLALINSIYDENQYFGNDIINIISGNFVDCGAFNGDTFKRFLKQIGNKQYNYYAFEAEKSNYDALTTYCKINHIKNVNAYNIAVYDSKTQLSFSSDDNTEKVSGKISDDTNTNHDYIQADSIDNVLANQKIDMITMDIEGAEPNALRGASISINMWHPKLAISAYHAIEHLWEIPLLIYSINPNYQFYYRHHRWNMDDTVCYAIYDNSKEKLQRENIIDEYKGRTKKKSSHCKII